MQDYYINRDKKTRICSHCRVESPFVPSKKLPKKCPHCRTRWKPLRRNVKRSTGPREKRYYTPTSLMRSEPGSEHVLVLPVFDEDNTNQACPFAHERDDEIIGYGPKPREHIKKKFYYREVRIIKKGKRK